MPPQPLGICRRASVVLRMARRARDRSRVVTFGCVARNSRERQAVGRVLRHAKRQRLRAAQDQPRIERAQDRAGGVLNELAATRCRRRALAMTTPPIESLWPLRYFVVLWMTRSAPSASGRCRHGLANVLSTASVAPCACASVATAAMSREPQHRIGRRLDEHQLRLRRERALGRGQVRRVDEAERAARSASAPCRTAGTCRRTCCR